MPVSVSSSIAFLIGTCPFCGTAPKKTGMISETDVLYRCPVCDFPVEAFVIMGFLQQYEFQLDQHCQQIDAMLQSRGHLTQ